MRVARIALIGVSGYGKAHLRMIRKQVREGRARLVAAVVINPGQESEECDRLRTDGCRLYPSTYALWAAHAGDIDLCFIPTAIHWHASMAREAMEAGAHVMVEKPLTPSVTEAQELLRIAENRRRILAVGFQDVYRPSSHRLKQRILSGELGEIHSVRIAGAWPRTDAYYRRNGWAGKVNADGRSVLDSPVSNGLAHFLNLALYLLGPAGQAVVPTRALTCDLWRARAIESFDTCSLRLATEGGVPVSLHVTHSCLRDLPPTITIQSSRASVRWEHEGRIEIAWKTGALESLPLESLEEARLMLGEAVIRRVQGETVPYFPATEACEHVRIFSELHRGFPIRTIAEEAIDRVPVESELQPAVRGIEDVLAQLSSRGTLFSEDNAVLGRWLGSAATPRP